MIQHWAYLGCAKLVRKPPKGGFRFCVDSLVVVTNVLGVKANINDQQVSDTLNPIIGSLGLLRGKSLYEQTSATDHARCIRALRTAGCTYKFISDLFGRSSAWAAVLIGRKDKATTAANGLFEKLHIAECRLESIKETITASRDKYDGLSKLDQTVCAEGILEGLFHSLGDFLAKPKPEPEKAEDA
jgi:hypothetical protein